MLIQRCRITGQVIVRAITLGVTVYGGYLGAAGLCHRDWIQAVGGTTLLTIGAILGAVLVIRRWLTQHGATIRSDLEALSTERSALEARARLIERQTETNQLRIESAQRRVDDVLSQLSRERGLRLAAERKLRDLAEDHNTLIKETLQAGADRFARRASTPGSTPQAPARLRAHIPITAARGDHE